MANKKIMCRSTMTRHVFWAEADCGNFGSLLRGMGHCSVAQSGSMGKSVEDAGASGKTVKGAEVVWKQVEDQKGARRGQEEVRKAQRPWKRAEEAGRLGKVTLRYTYESI